MNTTQKLLREANEAMARCDEAKARYEEASQRAEEATRAYAFARYLELGEGEEERETIRTVYPEVSR